MAGNTVAEANATALLLEDQSEKARQAYIMRRAGKSWWDVAEALQVSEGVAKGLLAEAIAEAAELVSEHTKRHLLAMEVARLDELMASHWDSATETREWDEPQADGSIKHRIERPSLDAARFCADIVIKRAKLTGLEQISDLSQTHQTVVVAGTSQEYIAALQLIVNRPAVLEESVDGAA